MRKITLFRLILIILSVALVGIPLFIVSITDQGFGELASRILVSVSILCAIAAIMLGTNKKNKDMFFAKSSISIGLLIVLASIWI